MGWALLTLLKVATVDGISKTLERLDTTPKPRFPDQASAIQGAVEALRKLPTAPTQGARRAVLLTARNHLSGCVTAYELDQLQVFDDLR
jgi:sensor domain CHASE-containing protein